MSYIELLKEIWTAVYDVDNDFDEIFVKYFHRNYRQCINGAFMNRVQYKAHALEQRKNMIINHIEYTHMLEKENEVFALYYPEGIANNTNQPIKAEVIAYFQFLDQQVLQIHGQVRLMQGDLTDVDMKE